MKQQNSGLKCEGMMVENVSVNIWVSKLNLRTQNCVNFTLVHKRKRKYGCQVDT